MKWPWIRRPAEPVDDAAFISYLRFMEGRTARCFSFPAGTKGADQIVRDVEAIILAETRHMTEATHPERVREFQHRRGGRCWCCCCPGLNS